MGPVGTNLGVVPALGLLRARVGTSCGWAPSSGKVWAIADPRVCVHRSKKARASGTHASGLENVAGTKRSPLHPLTIIMKFMDRKTWIEMTLSGSPQADGMSHLHAQDGE